jgi:hypothetical protein
LFPGNFLFGGQLSEFIVESHQFGINQIGGFDGMNLTVDIRGLSHGRFG